MKAPASPLARTGVAGFALLLLGLSFAIVLGEAAAARQTGPKVEQMVVFRNGDALSKQVVAAAATARLTPRKRCAVSAGTPLAALIRMKPGKIGLRDFGSCSRDSARDSVSLFVKSIRADRNRGLDGWVYKVGRRSGTAGAADPAGPFGSGRLRRGQRVVWFYCHHEAGSCQRTLELRLRDEGGGSVLAQVKGYDDAGGGRAIAGAKVEAGAVSATTDAAGRARLQLPAGRHSVVASAPGAIRSFAESLVVR